jgi:DNA-3-methyladenine glycosylase
MIFGEMERILRRSFFKRSTEVVAEGLLGKILVREFREGKVKARVVETEAYFGRGDPASHASRRKTQRNQVMFGPPGRAYVYFTYGMHYLFNVVTEKEKIPGAVLIRALEPVSGIDLMKRRRPVTQVKNLLNGPARLTQALSIDRSLNGYDLTLGKTLYFEDDGYKVEKVVRKHRVGVPLDPSDNFRYYIADNPFVSKK